MTLVPSQFDPQLILRNDPTMPCQTMWNPRCFKLNVYVLEMYTCIYLSLCATTSATFWIRLGTNTNGVSRISSPPPSPWNVNGALSARRFSPMISSAIFLCFLSLAISIWNSFSQLLLCMLPTAIYYVNLFLTFAPLSSVSKWTYVWFLEPTRGRLESPVAGMPLSADDFFSPLIRSTFQLSSVLQSFLCLWPPSLLLVEVFSGAEFCC